MVAVAVFASSSAIASLGFPHGRALVSIGHVSRCLAQGMTDLVFGLVGTDVEPTLGIRILPQQGQTAGGFGLEGL